MQATVIAAFKTKKAAERLAATYENDGDGLNFRVIKTDTYLVVRDYDPSDAGRSFTTIEVTA